MSSMHDYFGYSPATAAVDVNLSREGVTDRVKLSVLWSESDWVSSSMDVTLGHVGVTVKQIKRFLRKSIITIDRWSVYFL